MVRFLLELHAFLGSPSDVFVERSVLKQLLLSLADEYSGLSVRPFDFLDIPGGGGAPQPIIDRDIHRSDLVVVVMGYKLGKGTVHELTQALDRFEQGRCGHLMGFFKRLPASGEGPVPPGLREMGEFRERVSGRMLYHEYENEADLADRASGHFRAWLQARQRALDLAVLSAPDHDEALVAAMSVRDVLQVAPGARPLSFEVDLAASATSDEEDTMRAFLAWDLEMPSDLESHHLARSLYRSLYADLPGDCSTRQFPYEVHEHLRTLIGRSPSRVRNRIIETLCSWIESPSIQETARNFAAFELGVNRVRNAADVLLERLADTRESLAVRNYACMSLGMIRDPGLTRDLLDVLPRVSHPQLRKTIVHAILFIEGLLGQR